MKYRTNAKTYNRYGRHSLRINCTKKQKILRRDLIENFKRIHRTKKLINLLKYYYKKFLKIQKITKNLANFWI